MDTGKYERGYIVALDVKPYFGFVVWASGLLPKDKPRYFGTYKQAKAAAILYGRELGFYVHDFAHPINTGEPKIIA